MRVLVTGAGGQLGRAVVARFEGHDVIGATRAGLDVGDRDQVLGVITTLRPDLVVHTAAFTAVDACEDDPDRAWRVNALGSRHVADGCRRTGAHLVAISSDYVFDGTSTLAYTEWDAVGPLGVYGRSKLAAEREVLGLVPGACVVRTSWLCGAGGRNFVATMLDLASASGNVTVVADQHGCPTFTRDLAGMIHTLAVARLPGVFHVTNQGATTWHGLARATFAAAGADPDRVVPVATVDLVPPRRAVRPAHAVLDNAALRLSGITLLPDHRESLARLVAEISKAPRVGGPAR